MYAQLLSLAQKVGAEAGALLLDRPLAFEVESKSTAIDIATQMDVRAEKFIVQSLLAARPDDGIIGEEGASVEEVQASPGLSIHSMAPSTISMAFPVGMFRLQPKIAMASLWVLSLRQPLTQLGGQPVAVVRFITRINSL